MKRLFSFSVTSTFTFILSVLAILVIAVSAPTMVQAVLGPAPALSGDVQPGNSIMASPYYEPKVNPAANFGSLSDNGTAAYMGIGIATPVSPLHIYSTTSTQPETIDLDGAQPITAQWNDYCNTGGSMSGSGFLARFARGSKASPANVANGDRLGFNVFGGWAGGWKHTAAIEAVVDSGTVSGSSLPTYMRFLTTPGGSTSRVERMRITSGGNVGIGTTNPTNAKLDVGTTSGEAVFGKNTASGSYGGLGDSTYGVHGYSDTTGIYGYGRDVRGVSGQSYTGTAVYGETSGEYGVYGLHQPSGNYGYLGSVDYAVFGTHQPSGNYGYLGSNDFGVYGSSNDNAGVFGASTNNYGVYGVSTSGYAGYFNGKANVTDNLTVGGKVGIGTSSPPNSVLQVNGAIATAFRSTSISESATASDSVIAVNATGGSRTITLPDSNGIAGRLYTVIKTDANANVVYVRGWGGVQTITGLVNYTLSNQGSSVTVVSDGSNWWIVSKN